MAAMLLLSLCLGALPTCPSSAGSQCFAELARDPQGVWRVAVSHDDTLAAVAAGSGLHVYDTMTGAALPVPSYPQTVDVAFSPEGGHVAVALLFSGIAVVKLSSGTQLWSDASRDIATVLVLT
eukprot:TRINITY_DN1085_c0_g1_i3.p2 TRINITY_DN1085_c0_g1~~TRINITY_DN1085_c0_g1_i3.p2  ORF type:complete len:123 (+),score=5.52 TRINITY_DN1085_c0_g1_i3:60-428(+)